MSLSRLFLLVPLALSAACAPPVVDGDDGAGDADPCTDGRTASAVETNMNGRVCEVPHDCISLAEANDRGMVAFSSASSGFIVENLDVDHEICIDGWFFIRSDISQDAGFGDPGDDEDDSSTGGGDGGSDDGGSDDGGSGDGGSGDGGSDDGGSDDGGGDGGGPSGGGGSDGGSWDWDDGGSDDGGGDDGGGTDSTDEPCDDSEPVEGGQLRMAPAQSISFAYGGGSLGGLTPDNPTWWCAEQTQVTQTATDFVFNGSHLPGPLARLAVNPGDSDGDGIEDHLDTSAGTAQTNLDIWAYEASHPVFTIGRVNNYVELGAGEADVVTLQVTNIGRVGGAVQFVETLPAGVRASDFSLEPDEITTDERGRTVLSFSAELSAAIDSGSYDPTDYDQIDVSFTVSLSESAECPLRHQGINPMAHWKDASGDLQRSAGSPLVVSCCTE